MVETATMNNKSIMKTHKLLPILTCLVIFLCLVTANSAEKEEILPIRAKKNLEKVVELLHQRWGDGEARGNTDGIRVEIDALLKKTGADPELLEKKQLVRQRESENFLMKLAVIALEMHEHPERIEEVGRKYIYGPSDEEGFRKYFNLSEEEYKNRIRPAVLRPHDVSPEDQREELRLAMEYFVVAPWEGGLDGAVPLLIGGGVAAIKNPRSILTLDEMAQIYALSVDDYYAKSLRRTCLCVLIAWPSEQSLRILSRQTEGQKITNWDESIRDAIFETIRMSAYWSPWQKLAKTYAKDPDENVRNFAKKVSDLENPPPPRPPDPNDPFAAPEKK